MKQLSVHLTDLCNSKCAFCVVASPLYTVDGVKHEEVVRFLQSNAGQGYGAVNLHGGEATTHPRFFETLELIKRLGYPEIHVQTNGIFLAKMAFARRTVESGANLFIVSLHAADAALHDELTHTPGGFEKTLEGIRNVKALGARVRTNTVVTRQNTTDLPLIVRLACDLGVDHVNISNFHPVGSSMFSIGRTLPRLKTLGGIVKAAGDVALAAGRRLTLEGFPFCSVPELIEHQLNTENRQIKMLMRGQVISDYDGFMTDRMKVRGAPCQGCSYQKECGGVYPEYIQIHGWEEFSAVGRGLAGIAA